VTTPRVPTAAGLCVCEDAMGELSSFHGPSQVDARCRWRLGEFPVNFFFARICAHAGPRVCIQRRWGPTPAFLFLCIPFSSFFFLVLPADADSVTFYGDIPASFLSKKTYPPACYTRRLRILARMTICCYSYLGH